MTGRLISHEQIETLDLNELKQYLGLHLFQFMSREDLKDFLTKEAGQYRLIKSKNATRIRRSLTIDREFDQDDNQHNLHTISTWK